MMKKICIGSSSYSRHSLSLRRSTFLLVIVLSAGVLAAQSRDSLGQKPAATAFRPSPSRAALLSLVPGGGQIYNRRYWKAPIVYAAMGGLFLLSRENRKDYLSFKTAYELALQGKEHEFSSLNLPPSVLRNARDESRKSLEESYIFLSLVYIAQIAEAYVDAHLQDFDVTDDLSLRLKPGAAPTPFGAAPGLALVFQWHRPAHGQALP